MSLLQSQRFDIDTFTRQFDMSCQAALNRLKIGVPATVEHAAGNGGDDGGGGGMMTAKSVAETVQAFITLMDALKLDMRAVDHLHPLMGELLQSLNKIGAVAIDSHRQRLRQWLITLNQLRASDELDDAQVRQLIFDLEQAHAAFYRALGGPEPKAGG